MALFWMAMNEPDSCADYGKIQGWWLCRRKIRDHIQCTLRHNLFSAKFPTRQHFLFIGTSGVRSLTILSHRRRASDSERRSPVQTSLEGADCLASNELEIYRPTRNCSYPGCAFRLQQGGNTHMIGLVTRFLHTKLRHATKQSK